FTVKFALPRTHLKTRINVGGHAMNANAMFVGMQENGDWIMVTVLKCEHCLKTFMIDLEKEQINTARPATETATLIDNAFEARAYAKKLLALQEAGSV